MVYAELSYFIHYAIAVCLLISVALLAAFFCSTNIGDLDKLTPYECGFHPFEDAHKEFTIHFYLVALLFVAFDLEVLLLLPWALVISFLGIFPCWVVFSVIGVLFFGFVYEWMCGVLDW